MAIQFGVYKSFVPTNLSGLIAWFDMQDPTAFSQSGGNMVSITNKVSSTVYNTAYTVMPGYNGTGINGFPCMTFNGTTQGIQNGESAVYNTLVNADPYTVYIVMKVNTANATTAAYGVGDNASTQDSRVWGTFASGGGAWLSNILVNGTSTSSFSTGANNTNNNIICFSSNGTDANISANNNVFDPNGGSLNPGSGNTYNAVAIGRRARTAAPINFSGNIGEIIHYTTAHTTAERERVFDYLSTKWTIAIA